MTHISAYEFGVYIGIFTGAAITFLLAHIFLPPSEMAAQFIKLVAVTHLAVVILLYVQQ